MTVKDALWYVPGKIVWAFAMLVFGRWKLIYEAGFADRQFTPTFDPRNLRNLKLATTANLDPNAWSYTPEPAQTSPPRPAQVRFTLRRPAGVTGQLAVGTVIYPFPDDLRVFIIEGTFAKPEGPHGQGDSWASVVTAREGQLDDPGTSNRIAVSLQAAYDDANARPGIRMNTPGGALPGTPEPFPDNAGLGPFLPAIDYDWLFTHESVEEPTFTIQMCIDRDAQDGLAMVSTYPISAWPRHFINPFIRLVNSAGVPNVIGVGGLALAIARGNGPVAVSMRKLRMYALLPPRDLLLLWASATRFELVSRALRAVRRRLIQIAFEHAARDMGQQ